MSTETRTRTGRSGTPGGSDGPAEGPRPRAAERGSGAPGAAEHALPRTDGGPAARGGGRSVVELLRELSGDGADLVRKEVELARAEMSHKVDVFQRNAAMMAMGGAFLLAALLAALWAVNRGLTALLSQVVSLEIAVWLSPLILAAALAAAGWGMIQRGRKAVAQEGLAPDRTMDSLDDDREWVGRKAREMKEEIQHG